MDKSIEDRIQIAMTNADEDFWKAVTVVFPEATTGDMDPMQIFHWREMVEEVIRAWVENNVVEA